MSKVKYSIGADFVLGKNWGTVCVARSEDFSNKIEIISIDRLECESSIEFKRKVSAISLALMEFGSVTVLYESTDDNVRTFNKID